MSILGWIILGLIAGFIASKIVESRGQGFLLNILLGIVGGMVGGWLFEHFGGTGITGFNLWSMFVAVIGAVVVLVAYHLIRRVAQSYLQTLPSLNLHAGGNSFNEEPPPNRYRPASVCVDPRHRGPRDAPLPGQERDRCRAASLEVGTVARPADARPGRRIGRFPASVPRAGCR